MGAGGRPEIRGKRKVGSVEGGIGETNQAEGKEGDLLGCAEAEAREKIWGGTAKNFGFETEAGAARFG